MLATLLQGDKSVQNVVLNALMTLGVVVLIAAIQRRLLPRLRRWPLLAVGIVAGSAYLAALLISVVFVIVAVIFVKEGSFSSSLFGEAMDNLFSKNGLRGMAYGYSLILVVTFGVELSRRIGSERIANWLLGRYRNPKEEQRVFLFIDLSGSTPLAESLGAVRFSALLRDFFSDLAEPVEETGGEVVGYVGDEAIVAWRGGSGLEDANALRCFVLFRQQIARHSALYQKEYGVVPRYKASLHLGPVVATEVGERRSELVFHGDALNTAARILDECNPRGAQLLLSQEVAARMPPLAGVTLVPVGAIPLRGKAEPLGLVRATFGDAVG